MPRLKLSVGLMTVVFRAYMYDYSVPGLMTVVFWAYMYDCSVPGLMTVVFRA